MALVGNYNAATFVEFSYSTYPQLPAGASHFQPSMHWKVSGAGTVQGQPVVVGDLLFATQGAGRLFGDGLWGDQIFGGVSDGDWTVSQVFFLKWDSTPAPPDLDPYPNAGCKFTQEWHVDGDWAPGWRIVIDAYYANPAGSRTYGDALYGDQVFGDVDNAGGVRWVDITEPSFHIETGDGTTDGAQRVPVTEVVINMLDESGVWFDLAEPATWYQPQPGTPIRVGFIDPAYRYLPVFVGEIERIEDVHDADHPRVVAVRGFGRIMDLTVDVAGVQRPAELASDRFRALVALAGWTWDDGAVIFPADDARLLADVNPSDITVRDAVDATVQAVGWMFDSDRQGRMRVRTWPHQPAGPYLIVVDCREPVPGTPDTITTAGYLTPQTGLVTSPDEPGLTVTSDVVLTARLRATALAQNDSTIAGQWDNSAAWGCWISTGGLVWGWNTGTGNQTVALATPAQLRALFADGTDFLIGVRFQRSGRTAAIRSNDGGATWIEFGTVANVTAWTSLVNSTDPLKLGGRLFAPAWQGRIYNVQMATGTDPNTGTMMWRFDANGTPSTGTAYTDPRGRLWTPANTAAITPKVFTAGDGAHPLDPTSLLSHALPFANDQSLLLNHVVTSNTGQPAATVTVQDEVSISRFGKRGRAQGYPKTGLAWADTWVAEKWARRVLARFSYLTRHLESFAADTEIDQAWFPVLAELDTGRPVWVERRGLPPYFYLTGVVVGWRHVIDPGRFQSTVFTSTLTPSM